MSLQRHPRRATRRPMQPDFRPDSWNAVVSTAGAVHAVPDDGEEPALRRVLQWARPAAGGLAVLGAVLAAVLQLAHSPTTAVADSGADSTLFSLTNSDRASNGVASLSFNGTLETIGEG